MSIYDVFQKNLLLHNIKNKRQEPTISLKKDVCPGCGGIAGEKTVRIEIWKFWWLRFILRDEPGNWWRCDQVILSPSYCENCASSLGKKQTFASVLAILPFLIVLGIAPPLQKNFFPFFFLFAYSFYLALWGNYTWADRLLYGWELNIQLKEWIPDTKGKVVFPVPASQCIFRITLFFLGGFLMLVVKEIIS
ncbi:MAG: hypothetical protein HXY53_05645 [Nitrospirae bacterium]|nr:hypothetical protein [Nitrospirota bacterium]